jgi:hypothetical protein
MTWGSLLLISWGNNAVKVAEAIEAIEAVRDLYFASFTHLNSIKDESRISLDFIL